MSQEEIKNEYLERVQAQQQKLEVDLKAQRLPSIPAIFEEGTSMGTAKRSRELSRLSVPENLSQAVNVRIVGFWKWKTVIVPPNAYVVHTRLGHNEALHLGLGISFKYNPYTDSFLVVPSTIQTILINAYCICREMQGLLVQGYVQWIIGDFATAYKKLDFTDAIDPMRLVNVQLREQAEATIKDKVSTMSIDDVLSDKQPIIQELTARLRQVAEGEGDSDKGLGLRIVTVQIKEAVVSSTRVWSNLQKPFRAERARLARLAELSSESGIKSRELEMEKNFATAQLENESEVSKIRAQTEAQAFDREQAEKMRRHEKVQEAARKALGEQNQTLKQEQQEKHELDKSALEHASAISQSRLEAKHRENLKEIELRVAQAAKDVDATIALANLKKVQLEKESERALLQLQNDLLKKEISEKAELVSQAALADANNRQTTIEIDFEAKRQKIQNDVSVTHLQTRLIEALPGIVESLPKPKEYRSIAIGSAPGSQEAQTLTSLLTQFMAILDTFRPKANQTREVTKVKK